MDLNEVVVFIKVVQTGSFTKAGQILGMPLSTVSEKVSSLERRLGVTLMQRTTRKLSVTPVGQAYFKKCVQGLETFKAAESEVFASREEPKGLFRITAPVEIGGAILPTLVSKFVRRFPKITMDVILTQKLVDFLSDDIDVAIRAGALNDSSLIAKKVGEFYFAPFASPRYLEHREVPKKPKDLNKQDCLFFSPLGKEEWKLERNMEEILISPPRRMSMDDTAMLKAMTLLGEGISLLPTFSVYNEVQRGELIRVLPGWASTKTPVHIVYPSQRFVGANLTEFMKMAGDHLKETFHTFAI